MVKLEKYPETPLPREMIDMEVQNLEQTKERENGMCTRMSVMCLIQPSPARKHLVAEAGTALPACGSVPQVAASAVRLSLVPPYVPKGSQSFYHPL